MGRSPRLKHVTAELPRRRPQVDQKIVELGREMQKYKALRAGPLMRVSSKESSTRRSTWKCRKKITVRKSAVAVEVFSSFRPGNPNWSGRWHGYTSMADKLARRQGHGSLRPAGKSTDWAGHGELARRMFPIALPLKAALTV